MESWTSPLIPATDPQPGPVRIFDTATQSVVAVGPASGTARLYVCGITPYDATHLGHAHTYLAFDLLNRAWRDAGLTVCYAQNVTDVDDPLLERAAATGVDWRALAAEQTQLFRDDMAALRIVAPDDLVGVVEAVDEVADLIGRLPGTYDIDGDWYFPHAEADDHISHVPPAERPCIFGERGGDPERPGKHHPLDQLLWRAERPGEPAWLTPLGAGRPGWHAECAAIALNRLGEYVDVLGGGSDLAFPHHEMSVALGRAVTGRRCVGAVVHAGMVAYEGEKMSKSRGNLVFVSRLRSAGHDPMAIRLALLAHHYRCDWEWTDDDLIAAADRLRQWRAAVSRDSAPAAGPTIDAVRDHLRHDLDAAGALRAVDAWAAANGDDRTAPAEVRSVVDALLGVAL